MSDNWLRYVPADPLHQPSTAQALAAEALLSSLLPQSEDVRSEFTEHPTFVDPGSNWSGVHCSSCKTDADAWWADAMSSAAEDDFADLTLSAPCCGAQVSLNELDYLWPSAFGRYTLEAMNPQREGLSPEQLELLSAAVGCRVREIPVHL